VASSLNHLIGTNAAHDEYLRIGAEGGALGIALLVGLLAAWVARGSAALPPGRRWLMRAIFIAFAIHSATDNTLIATTSSVFFIWVAAVFATAQEPVKAAI
jgi:O-antigen ligase